MLEKTLENPLDSKENKPVNPKGHQLWIFIGRTEAEAPILWPPDAKSWLTGKDPNAGKDWGQEKKGATDDEMVGWHHQLYGHELGKLQEMGEPGILQSVGFQRVGHDWVTELNWTYHIENTICNGRVPPARLGASQGPDTYPWSIQFSPMHRSHCLAFTRHSVSSDCRGTSILVDIKE